MASEREMQAYKEDKLYDLYMTNRLLAKGKIKEAQHYLRQAEFRTQAGMRKEEIEAVSDRVSKSMEDVE